MLDEVIGEINDLSEGAFAPLSSRNPDARFFTLRAASGCGNSRVKRYSSPEPQGRTLSLGRRCISPALTR